MIREFAKAGNAHSGSVDPLFAKLHGFLIDASASRALGGSEDAWVGSTRGSVRKDNQDRALVVRLLDHRMPNRSFFLAVVADGMGGLKNGDDAAAICVSSFVSRMVRSFRLSIPERLRQSAHDANDAVYQQYGGDAGSTISALCMEPSGATFSVNVGDSRIYGLTKSRELRQITKDDTLAGALGSRADDSPHNYHLFQFVGMGEGLEPNSYDPSNDIFDVYILTTDGIHGYSEDAFTLATRSAPNRLDLTRRLLNLSESLGGRDNATTVVMPNYIDFARDEFDSGVSINLWSATKQLDIWITNQPDEVTAQRGNELNITDKAAPPQTTPPEAVIQPARASKKTKTASKKTRASKPRPSKDQDALPLSGSDKPVVQIKFPKPDED